MTALIISKGLKPVAHGWAPPPARCAFSKFHSQPQPNIEETTV